MKNLVDINEICWEKKVKKVVKIAKKNGYIEYKGEGFHSDNRYEEGQIYTLPPVIVSLIILLNKKRKRAKIKSHDIGFNDGYDIGYERGRRGLSS